MFARYDQDLTPFFDRIRAIEEARIEERRRAFRETWLSVVSLFRRRQKV